MSDSRLADIEQEIEKHLNDDATLAKVSGGVDPKGCGQSLTIS